MPIDAHKFDEIARNVFAPVYPLLASQIIARTGIVQGVCLDLGSGGGYLGLALAELTELRVIMLDESNEMRLIAVENIAASSLTNRVQAVTADVHNLPFPGNSIDLVASRSSMFFWDDIVRAFREIDRVLAPGGQAYVGGGFGSEELKDKIVREMKTRNPDWGPKYDLERDNEKYTSALREAGIARFDVLRDESGFWIGFKKPGRCCIRKPNHNFITI